VCRRKEVAIFNEQLQAVGDIVYVAVEGIWICDGRVEGGVDGVLVVLHSEGRRNTGAGDIGRERIDGGRSACVSGVARVEAVMSMMGSWSDDMNRGRKAGYGGGSGGGSPILAIGESGQADAAFCSLKHRCDMSLWSNNRGPCRHTTLEAETLPRVKALPRGLGTSSAGAVAGPGSIPCGSPRRGERSGLAGAPRARCTMSSSSPNAANDSAFAVAEFCLEADTTGTLAGAPVRPLPVELRVCLLVRVAARRTRETSLDVLAVGDGGSGAAKLTMLVLGAGASVGVVEAMLGQWCMERAGCRGRKKAVRTFRRLRLGADHTAAASQFAMRLCEHLTNCGINSLTARNR
jgi:hypothetical protein